MLGTAANLPIHQDLASVLKTCGSALVTIGPAMGNAAEMDAAAKSLYGVTVSTSDVESLVTIPLENEMSGLPGLANEYSTSVPQLSSILLVFTPGTDLVHARQLVQERLRVVRPSLPRWASPPVNTLERRTTKSPWLAPSAQNRNPRECEAPAEQRSSD